MKEPDRSYGAVVFDPAGNPSSGERIYLLVHHASGSHWGHPKGHPERGETQQDTARREIAEEAGILVDFIDGFSTEARWVLPDGREKIVRYFLAGRTASIGVGPENDKEILGLIWLPYRECRQKITYKAAKIVLDQAEQFLSKL